MVSTSSLHLYLRRLKLSSLLCSAITQVTVSLREDVDMKDSELDMGQKFIMTENESYEDIILKRNIVYQ